MQKTRYFNLLLACTLLGAAFFISTTKFAQRITHSSHRLKYYKISTEVHQQVQHLIQNKDYKGLRTLLQNQGNQIISLDELSTYGYFYQRPLVVQAALISKAIVSKAHLRHLKKLDIFAAVLCIDTELQVEMDQGRRFFPKLDTHLAFDIEFDPQTQSRFIHLEGVRGAKLGQGRFKVVTRSILYNGENSEIVARAVQDHLQRREINLTKLLMGSKGIIEAIAVTSVSTETRQYHSIFTKLYHPGSLHSVLKSPIKFTLKEKMAMALNILEGVSSLHNNNITHRDLGARNYLVNIETTSTGQRMVTAVVSDLGRAISIEHAAHTKPQGNSAYLSPEALFTNQMHGQDYLPSDIYAAGCVLYQIFHEKVAPWQVFGRTTKPVDVRHQELVDSIILNCQSRIEQLSDKQTVGTISQQEKFEFLILKMCSPNPQSRGIAQELRDEMQKIIRD